MFKSWVTNVQEPQVEGPRTVPPAAAKGDYATWLGLTETPTAIEERRSRWAMALPRHVRLPAGGLPYIIAVGGGKGGVGKSLLSANLAAKLAESGSSVLLVDLDIGCANLHTHFGMPAPEHSLADFLVRGTRVFPELAMQTAIPRLSLIAGGREDDWANKLAHGSNAFLGLWNALLRTRIDQGADFLVLDLGAGTHQHTMDFFTLAHTGVVVVLPEPTSIENTYVFLKTALWRIIENIGHRAGAAALAGEIKGALSLADPKGTSRGYAERLRNLASLHPLLVKHIFSSIGERNIGIVVNQTRSQQDIDIGTSMELICQKYFGFHARYLGHLNYDESVWKSVRNRRLLVQDAPQSVLTKRFLEVAQRVLAATSF